MTNISTLGQSLDQLERLKSMQAALGTLQYQLSSGKKTNLFKGLQTDVITSQRARANFKEIDVYMNNITIADRRVKMMVSTIGEITKHTDNVLSAMEVQTQQGEFEIESVGDLARKSLSFILNLMNEMDGDRYLFGGADSQTRPLNASSPQSSYMRYNINEWVNGNIDTDALIASYRDSAQLTDTINGYSAALSSNSVGNNFVRVSQTDEIDYTLLANNEGFRDIITAIGMMGNLTQVLDKVVTHEDDPLGTVTAPGATRDQQNENFYKVFNDIATMMTKGLDKLQNSVFSLSQAQARLTQIKDDYAVEKNTLAGVIADVEDADPNEVAMKINMLGIQIDASYRVTAMISELSLAYYLR